MLDTQDYTGFTPLFYVRTVQMAIFLIQHGANVNHEAMYGYTALHQIAVTGRVHGGDQQSAIIELLLNHGADIDAIAEAGLGTHAMQHAARHDGWEGIQTLRARGAV